jgi:hypothetical protein
MIYKIYFQSKLIVVPCSMPINWKLYHTLLIMHVTLGVSKLKNRPLLSLKHGTS